MFYGNAIFLSIDNKNVKISSFMSSENIQKIRGMFQKYAERFHRMFAIEVRLMVFHVKHAWYMFIKYK